MQINTKARIGKKICFRFKKRNWNSEFGNPNTWIFVCVCVCVCVCGGGGWGGGGFADMGGGGCISGQNLWF